MVCRWVPVTATSGDEVLVQVLEFVDTFHRLKGERPRPEHVATLQRRVQQMLKSASLRLDVIESFLEVCKSNGPKVAKLRAAAQHLTQLLGQEGFGEEAGVTQLDGGANTAGGNAKDTTPPSGVGKLAAHRNRRSSPVALASKRPPPIAANAQVSQPSSRSGSMSRPAQGGGAGGAVMKQVASPGDSSLAPDVWRTMAGSVRFPPGAVPVKDTESIVLNASENGRPDDMAQSRRDTSPNYSFNNNFSFRGADVGRDRPILSNDSDIAVPLSPHHDGQEPTLRRRPAGLARHHVSEREREALAKANELENENLRLERAVVEVNEGRERMKGLVEQQVYAQALQTRIMGLLHMEAQRAPQQTIARGVLFWCVSALVFARVACNWFRDLWTLHDAIRGVVATGLPYSVAYVVDVVAAAALLALAHEWLCFAVIDLCHGSVQWLLITLENAVDHAEKEKEKERLKEKERDGARSAAADPSDAASARSLSRSPSPTQTAEPPMPEALAAGKLG